MSKGWIRVGVPHGLATSLAWTVRVGDTTGQPGDLITAPSGGNVVVLQATIALPIIRAEAWLQVPVDVSPQRVTDIYLGHHPRTGPVGGSQPHLTPCSAPELLRITQSVEKGGRRSMDGLRSSSETSRPVP
jgi:hypothetical protein